MIIRVIKLPFIMKKILSFAIATLCVSAAMAQQALGPGTGIVSPEINADNSVTFRYVNPKAITVQISGDFLPAQEIEIPGGGKYALPGKADLVEKDGVWTFTSQPLKGDFYSYNFVVDGQRSLDPSNVYLSRDIATFTQLVSDLPSTKKYSFLVLHSVHIVSSTVPFCLQ